MWYIILPSNLINCTLFLESTYHDLYIHIQIFLKLGNIPFYLMRTVFNKNNNNNKEVLFDVFDDDDDDIEISKLKLNDFCMVYGLLIIQLNDQELMNFLFI